MTSPFSYFIVIYADTHQLLVEDVPKLTHKKLYNFAALFVGQGKNTDTEITEAFLQFIMRSFETLIENHVGTNFKPKTLRYLFTRLSDTTEFPNHPFRTDVKRNLAERVYNAICTNQEIIYPANLEVAETHKTSINNLIDECRQRLHGLNLTEADYYAKPHLYLPMCNWDQFNEALRYIFRNFEAIKSYYTIGLKKLKYHSYRNKQKALTEMCKQLFTGSRKYQEGNPDIQQANQQKWKPLSPRDNAGEAERHTSSGVWFCSIRWASWECTFSNKGIQKSLAKLCQINQTQPAKFKKVRRYD
ncbi:uncharacterized protein BX663DRAFT_559339 [Cokeromyces recurvatus]|uniref:uncharacterized protein n=1 Tax=Cokeromyces recurvatus TaxID=90255 RepID=UPI0022209F87|nr:uncharacterized protein BX663DRAFT_559339 [Cokeromyces recurvatus]KAI7905117.1 hypothetical protein BX663DRAFT_559339 [Cokeromyces recurvatus]